MADRIYPSSKPTTTTTAAPKSQLYNATRPMYRPQPPRSSKRSRSGRGLCCSLCLWLTLLLVVLIFLAAIAAGVFYLVYRPHRPSFSLSSLRLSSLNLSSSSLTSHLDISITARNPNKKLVYVYDDITITTITNAAAGAEVTIGTGTVPGFVHDAGNTTVVRAKVASEKESVDSAVAADLKKKKEIPVEIQLETRAGVKVGGLKTKKIGVSVACGAATMAIPAKGKKAAAAADGDAASCKVKLRIKIWKWTL